MRDRLQLLGMLEWVCIIATWVSLVRVRKFLALDILVCVPIAESRCRIIMKHSCVWSIWTTYSHVQYSKHQFLGLFPCLTLQLTHPNICSAHRWLFAGVYRNAWSMVLHCLNCLFEILEWDDLSLTTSRGTDQIGFFFTVFWHILTIDPCFHPAKQAWLDRCRNLFVFCCQVC